MVLVAWPGSGQVGIRGFEALMSEKLLSMGGGAENAGRENDGPAFSSDRQHLSYDGCLKVRGEIIRTVLCCVM